MPQNSLKPSARPDSWRATVGLLAVALLWLASIVFISPIDDFPMFDDWVYSWSAFGLAGGRGLAVPEWSSVYPLAHIGWGAAFVGVFGAADWVLRLATVALAALGHLCWYALLRDNGVSSRWAVLAVAATAFHPIYYLLTLTFMTDVPMVALWQIGLYASWRWLADDRRAWLLLATASGLSAAYVRQTGAALLLGILIAALLRRGSSTAGNARSKALEILLPLTAICGVFAGVLMFGADVGERLPMTARSADLLHTFHVSPWVYVDGFANVAAFVGFTLAPFAALRCDTRWFVAFAILFVSVWILGEAPTLRTGTMWGACELGGAASLLSTRPVDCAWAAPARAAALVAAALGWSALGPAIVQRLRATLATREAFPMLVVTTFATFAVGLFGLWLFADRYWIGPALLAAGLLLPRGDRVATIPASTIAGVAAFALIAVVGTASVFDFYRTVDGERRRLLDTGVSSEDIDAGYAQNGRHRYLVLPRAAGGAGRNHSLPWVTGIARSRYSIENAVVDDGAGGGDVGRIKTTKGP